MRPNSPSASPQPASNLSQEPPALVAKGDVEIGAGASPRSLSAADLLGRVVAARDLDKQHSPPPCWLWRGYLGPGKVTLLTSQWKSGKTTLVSLLLARMQQGGRLSGLPVAASKAFVISEESESDWQLRFQHLGIPDHVDLLCRPGRQSELYHRPQLKGQAGDDLGRFLIHDAGGATGVSCFISYDFCRLAGRVPRPSFTFLFQGDSMRCFVSSNIDLGSRLR